MCSDLGISKGLLTDLKYGRKKGMSAATADKIASYFGVSISYLLGTEQTEKAPALTKRDERDIAKRLNATLEAMSGTQGALMFDGEPIDDETRELLETSLRNTLEIAKRLAKQKYTPKKYRKGDDSL